MNEIQALNSRHYKIIELCLRGWTNKQIAEHLSMGQQQVSVVLNSPSFQHELAIRRAKMDGMVDESIVEADDVVDKAIHRHTLAAAERLGLVVNSKNAKDADAIRASEAILDRGGHPRAQQIESRNLTVLMDAETARRIEETLAMEKK